MIAPTLDDVIGDVTRLRRDVIEAGDSSSWRGRAAANTETLAGECRQLVVDCRQLVSTVFYCCALESSCHVDGSERQHRSVFYCSTADVTRAADRALRSLSALIRHSRHVTCDVSAPSSPRLVYGAIAAPNSILAEAHVE